MQMKNDETSNRLLIVDDDPMMRILVKGHLDGEKYQIEEAENGLEALERLSEKDFALALIDLNMPGMHGEQLLDAIRRKDKYMGLIVFTSEDDLELSYRLLNQYELSDYLIKPLFSDLQLKFSIKNALTRRAYQLKQDHYIVNLEYLKHQAEQAKSHFLTQMSHELNTPMNVILGFGQLLETMDKDFTDKQKSYIKHIVKAGWTLMDMIDKILTLSSVDFDLLNLKLEAISVDDIVSDVVRHFLPEIRNRNLTVTQQKLQLQVMADRVHFRAIIYSFISNAIMYNHQDGVVKITCKVNNNMVQIAVEDNGIGIAQEKLDCLFTPFERLGKELNTVSGAGVSLTLAQKLTEAMHGDIYCKSEKDLGSTFYLELPIAPP